MMLSNYFNPTVIAEWCTLAAALLLLNKKTGKWRLFILLMFLTVFVETVGWYQSNVLKKTGNAMPFNFLMIGSVSFFLWLLAQAETHKISGKTLYGTIMCFIVASLANLLFLQGPLIYNSFTEMIGDIMLAIGSGLVIFGLMKDEAEERTLFSNEYLWLSIGILFSALGSAVLYMFLDELQQYSRVTHINVYGYINYTVNILLYSCLIIAFVCRRRAKSSPAS